MSNQLLNKLKGIETSRASLENLLKEKEIDIGNSKSLPSLVAQVSKLKNPNWTESSEKWGGLTEEETPIDYYKGDDDWKDLIDIDSIIDEYDSTSYQGAVFMLFRVSANPDDSWSSSYLDGFTAYRFSDTKTVSTSLAHTWDADQDIVAENGERFRWVICFTSSTTCTGAWVAQYLVPEAVVYYKGQFRGCTLSNYYSGQYYLSHYSDSSSDSTNDFYISGATSYYYNTPKYFEIKEGVICDVVTGSPNSVYSVKTVIINGVVRSTIYLGICPDLRYFIYTNQVTPEMRVCLPKNIQATENDKCYIKFNYPIVLRGTYNYSGSDSNGFGIGNFMYNNYTNIYLNDISNLYRFNFSDNNNCNIKIKNILNGNTSTDTTTFGYNKNCNIDIEEIYAVGGNCFDFCKNTNIKIGTVWGGIGNFAFRYCNKMNTDIICKSKSSTTYSVGVQPFYGTNIKVIDMSESRITSIANDGSSPRVSDSQYQNYQRFSFANNPTIEVIRLSNYITSIGDYEFSYMTNLKEFYMGNNVTSLGTYAFTHCEKLETLICSNTLQSIGGYAFSYCSSLKTIDLGKQITKIPEYCFQYCTSLENVVLPDSLTTFGDYCFLYCTSLKTITLPNELTILPKYCFQYCSSLETISTTGTITNIGSYCFSYCSNLKNIFDFAGVVTIGQYAFEYCKSLILKLNDLSGIVSNSALRYTWSYIICDTNFDIVSNLYLWGAKWDNQGVLNFLYSLPTREEKSDYTIYLGYSYPAYYTRDDTPANSIYKRIKNKYVIEQDGKLIYTESTTEGAKTINDYVTGKNWVLA